MDFTFSSIKVKAGPCYKNCRIVWANCKTWNHVTLGGLLMQKTIRIEMMFFNRTRSISHCQLFSMSPQAFSGENQNKHPWIKGSHFHSPHLFHPHRFMPNLHHMIIGPWTMDPKAYHKLVSRDMRGPKSDSTAQAFPFHGFANQPGDSRVLMILKGFSSRSWQEGTYQQSR